jgi:hypothetical protein
MRFAALAYPAHRLARPATAARVTQRKSPFSRSAAAVTNARNSVSQTEQEVGGWVALQQARMDAQDKNAKHQRELNAINLARASDLFVDTSAVVRAPVVIITSRWYRPVLYGAIWVACAGDGSEPFLRRVNRIGKF